MKIYFVKQGDALSEIGKRFDVPVEELVAANPMISSDDELRIGMKLLIPSKKQSKPGVWQNKNKDKNNDKDHDDNNNDPISDMTPLPQLIPNPSHPIPLQLSQQYLQQQPQQYLQQQPQQYLQQQPQQYAQLQPQQYPQQQPQQYAQHQPQQYPQQFQQQSPAYPPFATFPNPALKAYMQAGLPPQGNTLSPWTPYPTYEQQGIEAPYNTPFNLYPYKKSLPKPPEAATPTAVNAPSSQPQSEWNPYRLKTEKAEEHEQDQVQEIRLHASPVIEAEQTLKPVQNKKIKKHRDQSLGTKLHQLQKKRRSIKPTPRHLGKSYPWMPD